MSRSYPFMYVGDIDTRGLDRRQTRRFIRRAAADRRVLYVRMAQRLQEDAARKT